jgi:hypothetical protein
MLRPTLFTIGLLLVVGLGTAQDEDPILVNLEKAKKAYSADVAKLTTDLANHWLAKEATARKEGSKPKLDAVKAERRAFEDTGEYPATMPKALQERLTAMRKKMDSAYDVAIKECIKAGRDAEAEQFEKQKEKFRKSFWTHVNLNGAIAKEDHLSLPPGSSVATKEEFSGPVEVSAVARTLSQNIRLAGPKGSLVIFNWESNPRELRVCRPDGSATQLGSQIGVPITPLKPNTWYRLRWKLTPEGMEVSVNDQVVFAEKRAYELPAKYPIAVRTENSTIDVKEFRVARLSADKK